MNVDIAANGPSPPGSKTIPAPGPAEGLGAGDELATTDVAAAGAAVTLDTIPASPPLEVMDAIAGALHASERLAASGRELRFERDPPTGKVTIAVHDLQGNLLSTVPPSKALDVADGASVD
jgi:hypothetical protein